jgi:hypothetical protein
MNKTLIAFGGAAILLTGCAGLTDAQQRMLTGSAAGAGSGAAIGAIGGEVGWGAAGGSVHERSAKAKEEAPRQSVRDAQLGL